ncbi:hypothetical protein F5880DRAFT_668576 [Lentinula raphanica]|nr:hypothetical protein F5880DRAFT_668576 [Lentinula raphanica]
MRMSVWYKSSKARALGLTLTLLFQLTDLTVMKLRTSILASVLSGVSLVNATAWVAGYQSSGYTGWNLRQVCILTITPIYTWAIHAWLRTSLAVTPIPSQELYAAPGRSGTSSLILTQVSTTSIALLLQTISTTMLTTMDFMLAG